MNETMFRNKVNDAVFLRDLQCDGEVAGGLGWEIDVNSFVDERGVRRRVANFNDMELSMPVSLSKEHRGLTDLPWHRLQSVPRN
jgi:hypothetical protein